MKILKAIRPKGVMGSIKNYLLKDGEFLPDGVRVPLYRLSGSATGFEEKDNTYGGISHALIGTFRAQPVIGKDKDGLFISNMCYLAEEISSSIASNLKSSIDEETGEIIPPTPIEFGFILSIITDSSSATSYIYEYETLMDLKLTDPLEYLDKKMPPLLKNEVKNEVENEVENGVENEVEKNGVQKNNEEEKRITKKEGDKKTLKKKGR